MGAIEFEPWPKIARLNRNIVITEKIDGTNAAVLIVPLIHIDHIEHEDGRIEFFQPDAERLLALVEREGFMPHAVFAQSRTRFITPEADNFGFARWVKENAEALVETLGEGRHFGEWWGSGIQRGYGLPKGEKRFSLFNTSRWKNLEPTSYGLRVVPILYWGIQSEEAIKETLFALKEVGSFAAGREGVLHQEAEGVIIFHTAGRTFSKVTLKGDEAPKGAAGHALDEERAA